MELYNTLTRTVTTFTPQHPDRTTVYTCGPTVYDYPHIGHWFTYLRTDLLIRTIKASGYSVEWVMNVTDVGHLVSDNDEGEDKLEKGARREGKTAWEVAAFFSNAFFEDMKQMNIVTPNHIVKATDHIPEQIALITLLEKKGYLYVIDDGVYYDTSLFPQYADFARLDVDEQQAGKRVSFNPQKRHSSDFAVWKFSPKNTTRDMEWPSPWGVGFPGWHIECSAMSMKYLGDTLDIHTGGIDHIPVHHSNEIAQSEAATGKRFANYWFHSNHLMVNGEKISKSLGNSIRLEDITAQGISAQALRLHILESHYRNQSKFSMESLLAAQTRLKDLEAMAVLRYQAQATSRGSQQLTFKIEDVAAELLRTLQNDLHTPQALAYLSAVSTEVQAVLLDQSQISSFVSMLEAIDRMLGLALSQQADISVEQRQLIAARDQARIDKQWPQADQLRDQLNGAGIGLRDSQSGTIWFRL
jgi:cysteinyl-tRNA synthetase